jgi:hypothetical protein
MTRIYVRSQGPEDWRRLLAEPAKQWRDGYSAKMLAECWEAAQNLPGAVRRAFKRSGIEALDGIEPLLVLPEYQTPLPGGGRPSQTHVFVLAKASGGLVAIAVEGKVEEPFGPTVDEWLAGASKGKRKRLAFICEILGLKASVVGGIGYQLLHRTAAAVIEAGRFSARHAVVLVHSFSPSRTWFEDYVAFVAALGGQAAMGALIRLPNRVDIELYCGWVSEDPTESGRKWPHRRDSPS